MMHSAWAATMADWVSRRLSLAEAAKRQLRSNPPRMLNINLYTQTMKLAERSLSPFTVGAHTPVAPPDYLS